jgi:hypothetical protein
MKIYNWSQILGTSQDSMKIYNWLKISLFVISPFEFDKYNKQHKKVMAELLYKKYRKTALTIILTKKNYNNFLSDLGAKNSINEKLINKSIPIFDKIEINDEQISNFGSKIAEKNLLINELNHSSHNFWKENFLICKIEQIFNTEELSYILYNFNNDFVFFFGIILKISITLSPAIGSALIIHYSEDSNAIEKLKNRIKNKIFINKFLNFCDMNKSKLLTIGVFSSSYYILQNRRNTVIVKNSFEIFKEISTNISKKIGAVIGSNVAGFYSEFWKEISNIKYKPIIKEFIITMKNTFK